MENQDDGVALMVMVSNYVLRAMNALEAQPLMLQAALAKAFLAGYEAAKGGKAGE